MKKLLLFTVFIPLLGMSQEKNILNATRVFPKADKVLEFEKALTAHARKYHTGDWNWRVYEIMSGPDAGGYHIVEGPASWAAFDKRGNLGTAHNNDWNKTAAIYLTDRASSEYSAYVDSMSTVPLGDYSDKMLITHIYPKPGAIQGVMDLQMKMKKVWKEGSENVAFYQTVNSGDPSFLIVTRFKEGFKELDPGYRKPLSQRYEMANGPGSWENYISDYSRFVERRWSELLQYRPDLSSK